jgi:ankyrin repeat protein
MKTHVLFLASFFSLAITCLAMEQDQKKVKVQETETLQPHSIPSLTELVLYVIAHTTLDQEQTLEQLGVHLKEISSVVPSHLLSSLMSKTANENESIKKYNTHQLLLILAETLLHKATADGEVQNKHENKKPSPLAQKAYAFLLTLLQDSLFKDQGQRQVLALAALLNCFSAIKALVNKDFDYPSPLLSLKQALNQLMYLKEEQKICTLMDMLPRSFYLENSSERKLSDLEKVLEYAQLNHCDAITQKLKNFGVAAFPLTYKNEKLYMSAKFQHGFLVGDATLVSSFLAKLKKQYPHISSLEEIMLPHYSQLALQYVVSQNYLEVVKLLLEAGAKPTTQDNKGFTPLHSTCEKNNLKLAQLLLSHGAHITVNTHAYNGTTPLHLACDHGDSTLVQALLDKGAHVDVKVTPKQSAIEDEYCEEEPPYLTGNTPLHISCYTGNYDVAKLLLVKRASLQVRNAFGQTPFHSACESGNEKLVTFLLEHGASIEDMDSLGNTALHTTCESSSSNEHAVLTIAVLLEKGANPNVVNHRGNTPLHTICEIRNQMSGREDIIELLLKHGALGSIKNNEEQTPLDILEQADDMLELFARYRSS